MPDRIPHNAKPPSQNVTPKTRNPEPATRNSELGTRNSEPGTRNLLILGTLLILISCTAPPPSEEDWQQAVSQKNLGLAYLYRTDYEGAVNAFETVIDLVPEEPLGYADLAVAYLKLQNPVRALDLIENAVERAPEDGEILAIQADAISAQGNPERALEILRQAVQNNPSNVRLRYKYLTALKRFEGPAHRTEESIEQLEAMLQYDADNLAILSELSVALTRTGRLDRAAEYYDRIGQLLAPVPDALQPYLNAFTAAVQQQDAAAALRNASILGNLLKIDPDYRKSRDGLGDPSQESPPLRDFRTAPADLARSAADSMIDMRFTDITESFTTLPSDTEAWQDIALTDLDGDGKLDMALAARNRVFTLKNGDEGWSNTTDRSGLQNIVRPNRLTFSDIDNDGDQDLYVLGDRRNDIYLNNGTGTFSAVRSSGLSRSLSPAEVLFADYDHDGDLDILSSDLRSLRFYRYIEDGRFEDATDAAGFPDGPALPQAIRSNRPVTFGDFDLDGALDVAAVFENGQHRLFRNIRQGRWTDWTDRFGMPAQTGMRTVITGDFNQDGTPDLFMAGADAVRILWNERGRRFDIDSTPSSITAIFRGLHVTDVITLDFDNDGFLDIAAGGTSAPGGRSLRLARNIGRGRFEEASHLLPDLSDGLLDLEIGDLDQDGDQDLVALTSDGLHVLRNDGGNTNSWFDLELAAALKGSGKNNFYGIGSTIEVNTETHYQSLLVTSPVTHIGIGKSERADVVRVIWSNGIPQNRVNPEPFTRIIEPQRLKGSCPSLYTWNGERYVFVTHLMTRSAIGAMNETGAPAFPDAAHDYVKIRGDQMQPQDGKFVINIVEELWDAVYLDQMQLMAVDHPGTTDIYVDEKYVPPPYPDLQIYTATNPRLPIAAYDHHGHDILPRLAARDSLYAGDYALGDYQGVPESHSITLDLGNLSDAERIQLYLCGWIMPVEPSSNLALSQRKDAQVNPPYLEVPDDQGQWQTVIPYTGFPSGEHKTMIIDLSGRFLTDDYRVRITTNLQLYWSEAFFTIDEPATIPMNITPLAPILADLHYRGYSREYQAAPYGPFLRDYNTLSTAPQWLPFEGYRTRYGDVTPLLQASDNRYAIYSSGEEVTVTFDATALPPLPAGWTRDYILYSDGWLKEGDLNTDTAATIEPLPFHGMPDYPYSPSIPFPESNDLEEYRSTFNTRWVSQKPFREEIRSFGEALEAVDKSR